MNEQLATMFSDKDPSDASYPTQWALNPSAYQGMDSNQVDWATLAQQWIAMKEAVAIVGAPNLPSKSDIEEGEAPMEVENPDTNNSDSQNSTDQWNTNGDSWGNNWNQWGSWGWQGSGVDPKMPMDPTSTAGIPSLLDTNFPPPPDAPQLSGYSTTAVPGPVLQHGYWTAPQVDQGRTNNRSTAKETRNKSRSKDSKSIPRPPRGHRDKSVPLLPPVAPSMDMTTPMPTLDAAKRRQLPAWIREGLEKMEREKQRAIEREQEKLAREEAEKEKKRLEEIELERLKAEAEASGVPMLPPKSKFESDSEGEDSKDSKRESRNSSPELVKMVDAEPQEPPPLVKKTREEIMQEVMLAVRRSLTEILLEVTDREINAVCQEELARYTTAQASHINAVKASKSKALSNIVSGLGLGAYESSSDESADEDEVRDISDQQLQDMIKRKRMDFERTSREIEAEVRRAELREEAERSDYESGKREDASTPDEREVSATPPPNETDTPEKLPVRRPSRDHKSNQKPNDRGDAHRKIYDIPEEKPQKSTRKERTSPSTKKSTSSSDSQDSSSSSSESEPEVEIKKSKKRKRRSTSSSDSRRKAKKDKKEKSHKYEEESRSKSKRYDDDYDRDRTKSRRKDDYYEKSHKSSRKDYERSHKDKYREGSDEERRHRRSKRSRSNTYESRRRGSRSRDVSRDRSRRSEKHDRYERSREYDRRRSRSRSRHRR